MDVLKALVAVRKAMLGRVLIGAVSGKKTASYSYDRTAKSFDLQRWGLGGLLQGEPVVLYHGTTRTFKAFDLSKSREDLVNKYYGRGIFLVPSKRIAEQYAEANRNIGFDPSIVDDLKMRNPGAGKFMEELVARGDDVWEDLTPDKLGVEPGEQFQEAVVRMVGGVDPNTIADVARYVLGSKLSLSFSEEPVHIFNMSTGMPEYMYANLDELGLDSEVYRPKVYKVAVKVENVLVTASKSEARKAQSRGYDCVVFHGSDLVGGVPEVAVFSPHKVKILGYEVV